MALKLYTFPEASYYFKETVPLTFTFDGRVGGAIDKKIYLRNDDPYRWYDEISLQAVDTNGYSMADGTEGGFYWKLAQTDMELHPLEWELISSGNSISIADALGSDLQGNVTSYIPIWVRVAIPKGLPIQVIKDIVIRISAREHYIENG